LLISQLVGSPAIAILAVAREPNLWIEKAEIRLFVGVLVWSTKLADGRLTSCITTTTTVERVVAEFIKFITHCHCARIE